MAVQYDYTVVADSVTMVSELTDIDFDVKLKLIEQSLEDSSAIAGNSGAGTTGSVYYRPYYVAARQIQRNRDDQVVSKADGAEFSRLTIMIQSLLEEQIALDQKYDLQVPSAYGSQAAIDLHCGCDLRKSCCASSGDGSSGSVSYLGFPTAFVI